MGSWDMVLNGEETWRAKLDGLRTVQDAKQNLMVSSICVHFVMDYQVGTAIHRKAWLFPPLTFLIPSYNVD